MNDFMEATLYHLLMGLMPPLAAVVFIALFFIQAGYGMFRTRQWGPSLPNKAGWVLMECPAVLMMGLLWGTGLRPTDTVPLLFFLLFEVHYVQRSFVFPFLMKGKSRMPLSIVLMGILFNVINGFLIGEELFHLTPPDRYTLDWLGTPAFLGGLLLFVTGMGINLHSDHVIRHLRQPGDTRHYLPVRGMYRYVTSGNYFGELVEWTGFAVLTQSPAAGVFVLWTFANLAPRAYAIRRHYRQEFGTAAVGNRKCLIPFFF